MTSSQLESLQQPTDQQAKNISDYIILNITVLILVTKYSFKVSKVFYSMGQIPPPPEFVCVDRLLPMRRGTAGNSRAVYREELKNR